jgi:NitT/TauT family transport system permease protein
MVNKFFKSEATPQTSTRLWLSLIFFAVIIAGYLGWAYERHLDNPMDKVVPTITQIYNAAVQVATQPDRTGKVWLWGDLKATSYRFGLSLGFVSTGILLGLLMGVFPYVDALAKNFVIALDKIVALSLLPLLMVMLGIEEGFRVGLVVIAVFPTIVLSAYAEAKAYPEQLKIKARTLGATDWELAFRIVLPGIMPKMLDLLRLNFKSIAGLVIAGEMIVASEGLGYRIAAVRRFMTMDVVIVYVIVITLLLYLADVAVTRFIEAKYPWFNRD